MASEEPEGSKEIQDKLIASELRYRKLFETAQDGILLIDPKTENIIDVNPYLLKMMGDSIGDVVGKKLWELRAIKDVNKSDEIVKALFEKLQSVDYVRYDDLPIQSRDGKRYEVETVANKYNLGTSDMIQCNVRDDTAHKEAAKKAAAYLAKLEETMKNIVNLTGQEARMTELKETIETAKSIIDQIITHRE
jgi:PAS domain S-box-containing protein